MIRTITKTLVGKARASIFTVTAMALAVTGGTAAILSTSQTAFAADPVTITVCAPTGCDFDTIQAAVDAANPGDTVSVGAGSYSEVVTVSKSIEIVGSGATLVAPAGLPSSGGILNVTGAGVNAEVSGLTVSGPGPSACGSIYAGIYVTGGAYANIHDLSVTSIRDSVFSGCQNGRAIYIGGTGVGTATVSNVVITDYQKGGVYVSNAGSSATITGNTITGAGPTATIAQNGIAVINGATASVSGNTVSGNDYTGPEAVATGILLFNAGAGTAIGPNASITSNEIGFYTTDVSQLANLNLTGVSGNTREAVADIDGAPIPSDVLSKSDLTGVADAEGNDIVTVGGNLYVYGYSAFNTIQAAIDGVAAGGTVDVNAGTYAGNLTVNKAVTLNGAQAGVDARTRSASESIVSGSIQITSPGVTVDGFTVTAPTAIYGIFVNGVGSVTLRNNILDQIGTSGTTAQGIYVRSTTVISGIDINQNLIQNVGPAGTVSNKGIFLGDSGFAGDISNVSIANNTIQNVQSGTKGAYGITTNRTASNLSITGNVISGLTGLWVHAIGLEGNTPNAIVTGNVISGLTAGNVLDETSVQLENNASAGTVTISNNQFAAGAAHGVQNTSGFAANAPGNWWGSLLGSEGLTTGTVNVTSWCTVSDCSSIFTPSPGTPNIPVNDQPVDLPESGNQATLPADAGLQITGTTPAGTVVADIPAGTTITANGTWDGVINPPTVLPGPVSLPAGATAGSIISIGSNSVGLTFDKGVRLLFPGQAGKQVGYLSGSNFTPITTVCPADSQLIGDALVNGGDCYINVGGDLVVWTKHFTTFVTYTPASGGSGSSGSGSSGSSSTGSTGSSAGSGTTTTSSRPNATLANYVVEEDVEADGTTPQVAGAATTAGNVAAGGQSASRASEKTKNSRFMGLGWFWLIPIASLILGAVYFVVMKRAEDADKA